MHMDTYHSIHFGIHTHINPSECATVTQTLPPSLFLSLSLSPLLYSTLMRAHTHKPNY